MVQICPNCIVKDRRNNRQEGWFQMLKLDQFIKATSFMSCLDQWGNACSTAKPLASAGKLYHIAGAGKGSMTMMHHVAGPFRSWPLYFVLFLTVCCWLSWAPRGLILMIIWTFPSGHVVTPKRWNWRGHDWCFAVSLCCLQECLDQKRSFSTM